MNNGKYTAEKAIFWFFVYAICAAVPFGTSGWLFSLSLNNWTKGDFSWALGPHTLINIGLVLFSGLLGFMLYRTDYDKVRNAGKALCISCVLATGMYLLPPLVLWLISRIM
jgi:hypothetical protein